MSTSHNNSDPPAAPARRSAEIEAGDSLPASTQFGSDSSVPKKAPERADRGAANPRQEFQREVAERSRSLEPTRSSDSDVNVELQLDEVPDSTIRFTGLGIDHPELDRFYTQWIQGGRPSLSHVFLVTGEEGSGRAYLAKRLAIRLSKVEGEAKVYYFRQATNSLEVLVNRLRQVDPASKNGEYQVLIVEDFADSRQGGWSSVTESLFDLAESLLAKWMWRIVLVGPPLDAGSPLRGKPVHVLSTQGYDDPTFLANIAHRYLDAFCHRDIERLGVGIAPDVRIAFEQLLRPDRPTNLLERLRSPNHVYTLVQTLYERGLAPSSGLPLDAQIVELADRLHASLVVVQSPGEWFHGLSPLARLYALLAAAFEDLPQAAIDELCHATVVELRAARVTVRDLRDFSTQEILDEIKAELTDDGRLVYPAAQREECRRQLRNFRELLWTPLRIAADWCDPQHARTWKPQRRALGKAIGRLGFYHWSRLMDVMAKLEHVDAQGPELAIDRMELVAYILSQVIEESLAHPRESKVEEVLGLLQRWSRPGVLLKEDRSVDDEVEYLCAAAETTWRCYEQAASQVLIAGETGSADLAERTARDLQAILENIAGSIMYMREHGTKRFRCHEEFLYAIYRMFDRSPHSIARLLIGWIEQSTAERQTVSTDTATPPPEAVTLAADEQPSDSSAVPSSPMEILDGSIAAGEAAGLTTSRQPEDALNDDEEPGDDPAPVTADALSPEEREYGECRQAATAFYGVLVSKIALNAFAKPEISEEKLVALLDLVAPLLQLPAAQLEQDDFWYDASQPNESSEVAQQAIDRLFEALQHWVQRSEWRLPVFRVLLQAINRSRVGPRKRVCRAISNHWLHSSDSELRRIATGLLARSKIIAGDCVDLPGHSRGLILVDASDHAELEYSQVVAFGLYHDFGSQLDVHCGYLGTRAYIAQASQEVGWTQFHLDLPRPSLAGPLLEAERASELAFVIAASWRGISDLADLTEFPEDGWKERVIPSGTRVSQRRHDEITEEVNRKLAQILAARTADQWRASLAGMMPARAGRTPAALADYLHECSPQLDDLPPRAPQLDVARVISCGLLWLARWDMQTAVNLLIRWMSSPPEKPQTPLGFSCAGNLLRVLGAMAPVISPPSVPDAPATLQSFAATQAARGSATGPGAVAAPKSFGEFAAAERAGRRPTDVSATAPRHHVGSQPPVSAQMLEPLLQLGPVLASSNYKGMLESYLKWVRRWLIAPEFQTLFRRRQPGADLFSLVASCRADYQSSLLDWLRGWSARDQGVEAPAAAVDLSRRLIRHCLLGERREIPTLGEHEQWLVVLVDIDTEMGVRSFYRCRIENLVKDLFRRLHHPWYASRRIRPIVFRMGEDAPAAIPGDDPRQLRIAPLDLVPRAPLAAPAMERFDPRNTGAVLWICNRLPHDAEDVMMPWKTRGKIYVPRPGVARTLPWEVLADKGESETLEAAGISSRFRRLFKGHAHA